MRNPTALQLADCCEMATDADQGLDTHIWRAMNPDHPRWYQGGPGSWGDERDDWWWWGNPSTDSDWDKSAPEFTSSIDEAVGLIPEGCSWRADYGRPVCGQRGSGSAFVLAMSSKFNGDAATVALAICAAALRAKASQ